MRQSTRVFQLASWLPLLSLGGLSLAQSTSSDAAAGMTWAQALAAAQKLTSQMSLAELNNLTYGTGNSSPEFASGCSGSLNGLARLGIPRICFSDGSHGVHSTELVNAYAAGISVGASWNTELAYSRALYMGAEFKTKGAHVALGPVVGPLGRTTEGGRNWEGFSADPYLAGQMGASTITGLQKSVIATIKHYIGNEQETNRNPLLNQAAISSNIDDTTFHELYLWPFVDAVHAEVGAIMCSYNRLNSTYACEDPHSISVAKDELAFPGFMLSDWGAQHSGISSATAGLDIAMPNSPFWDDDQLLEGIQNGTFTAARLTNMVDRLLASWIKYTGGPGSNFPASGVGLPADLVTPHVRVDARNPASKPTILQGAIEGHVLVKNTNNALPLTGAKKPTVLSLFGYDALPPQLNTPSTNPYSLWEYGLDSYNITETELIMSLLGSVILDAPQSATLGTVTCGGGSGSNSNAYISDPYSAVLQQAISDDTAIFNDFISAAPVVETSSDACIVFINDFATEAVDRAGLGDPASDALVNTIASQCRNTIVVIHNAGTRVVDAWIDNANVTAVLFAHLPGQTSGQALVEIIYGKVSPSGRLPYTVAKSPSDYGYPLTPCETPADNLDPQCYFLEGPYFDYRRFLQYDITPRYPFGYGLTYSTFSYSSATAKWLTPSLPTSPPNPTTYIPGGIASLFDPLADITATITNTGSVQAAEVAQLYVQFPGETKVRHLRGFAKEVLLPGNKATVTFTLTRRDLSRWNLVSQMWELQGGVYKFYVGANVDDVGLSATLSR